MFLPPLIQLICWSAQSLQIGKPVVIIKARHAFVLVSPINCISHLKGHLSQQELSSCVVTVQGSCSVDPCLLLD